METKNKIKKQLNEVLVFCCRGSWWKVNAKGEIFGGDNNIKVPSGNWLFLGVSTHHWHNSIIYTFKEIWSNPQLANNGILWDLDHGTTRTWGGNHNNKLPRVSHCSKDFE